MATKKTFKVTAERDEAGWWVATAHGIQGVHTQAKTLATLRERMVEALDAAGEAKAEIELDLKLPAKAKTLVKTVGATRVRLAAAKDAADKAVSEAVRALVRNGVTVRDAGELLELSHQRVHQLASKAQ